MSVQFDEHDGAESRRDGGIDTSTLHTIIVVDNNASDLDAAGKNQEVDHDFDLEKNQKIGFTGKDQVKEFFYDEDKDSLSLDNKDDGENIQKPRQSFSSAFSRNTYLGKIYDALNVETIGISPIPESQKFDTSLANIVTMWFSANLGVAALSLGTLGPVLFDLDFRECVWTIVLFNFVSSLPVAYFSVFGSRLGLRQMVLTRFLAGNLTARVFSFLNVLACVGWTAINTGAAAQILSIINKPHNCPPWAGCLILLACTVLITFTGYRVVHLYEKWSWIPLFAVYIVMIVRLAKSGNFSYGSETGSRTTNVGNALSFGATIFSFCAGWAPYAADFTVYMPKTVSKLKIFLGVGLGLFFSLTFTLILGSACAVSLANSEEWTKLYDSNKLGGLVYGIMVQDSLHGFGQFCMVILAMSTVATNTPNMYSISLCAQAIWEPLSRIPRPVCTLLGSGATLVVSICAYYKFLTFMSNMMDAIGYFIGIYVGITLADFLVFKKLNFDSIRVEEWNSWEKLPIGVAGLCALFTGAVGVAMGMDETYWIGQISRKIGTYGGDIGWELGFCFSALTYVVVRPFEIKYFGR